VEQDQLFILKRGREDAIAGSGRFIRERVASRYLRLISFDRSELSPSVPAPFAGVKICYAKKLAADYEQMSAILFRTPPAFEEVMASIEESNKDPLAAEASARALASMSEMGTCPFDHS
jgi:hypothetical protein